MHQDDYGTQFATVTEVYERLDSTFDVLDQKITKVDDKLDQTREEVRETRTDILWIKRLSLPAIAAIVAFVPELARAIAG